jgi:DNA polymerase elongation subunit (family B)
METLDQVIKNLELFDLDFASLYPSFIKMYNPDSEPVEKTPTFNEPRLKPIKP